MNNKIVIIVFIILFVGALVFLVLRQSKNVQVETEVEELIPGEEINDEQIRNTVVTLYFKDKDSGELMPEARNIDVKKLMDDPYSLIINMLIEGPLNKNYERCIPENTKVNKCYLEGDVLVINFDSGFMKIEEKDEKEQKIVLDSILDTMSLLREINSIKILIDGESNVTLENSDINLSKELRKGV
ncbi:MAG: GerMN domain-containing protein [Clostridia bacterium]|nr:GerMN domain-containing protein [Clostridia bacterium]